MNSIKIIFIGILFLLCSCATEKLYVGNFNPDSKTTVYKEGKDIYLFWDKVPLQSVEQDLDVKNYKKITKRNIFDNITYYGSMGIFSAYTVKIKVEKTKEQ